MIMTSKIVIGIDPDMIASGFAVAEGKTLVSLRSVKLPDLVDHIKQFGGPDNVVVKLENPGANKTIFTRDVSGARNQRAVKDAIAIRVGKVMATTHHIKEILEAAGFEVKMVKPLTGKVKSQAKDDAEYFNRLTGWTERSNQDKRDAALIALYG